MSDNQNPRNFGEPIGEHVRIFRRGRKYYANYQLNGRQQRVSLKTTNKKEAEKRARKIEVEIEEGSYQSRVTVRTISEGIKHYGDMLNASHLAKKTIGKYLLLMKRVKELSEKLRLTRLDQIDLLFVDKYRQQRALDQRALGKKPPEPQTMHDEIVNMATWINFCVSRKLMPEDTLDGVSNPEPEPTEQQWWTWDVVQAILNACPEYLKVPITVLAHTGMRFGELQWLTWDDIDFPEGVLHLRPKKDWKLKTRDQRVVPMSKRVISLLRSHPRVNDWVTTMPITKHRHVAGKQWEEKRLLEGLKEVLGGLKLEGVLHSFRHSFISYCVYRGIPEAQIREWVGHVDAEIMARYVHIHSKHSKAAMALLMKDDCFVPNQFILNLEDDEKKSA